MFIQFTIGQQKDCVNQQMSPYRCEPSLAYSILQVTLSVERFTCQSSDKSDESRVCWAQFGLVCSPWICLCLSYTKTFSQFIKFNKHIKRIMYSLYGNRRTWDDYEDIFAKFQVSHLSYSKSWQITYYFIIKYHFFPNKKKSFPATIIFLLADMARHWIMAVIHF